MKYVPKPYMRRAFAWMIKHAGAGVFLQPGLGKTAIALTAYQRLRKQGHVGSALVIAPLRVAVSTWVDEPQKWDHLHDLRVVVLHGPKKVDLLDEDADIYVINPEGLFWLEDQINDGWEPPDMLVVDESTKFKHTNTKRFKVMRRLLPWFARRYILTGTPAPNGYMDLFGQVFLVDEGASLGRFITHFRREYYHELNRGNYSDYVLKRGAGEQIVKKIKPFSIFMSSAEYLDLPERIDVNVDVTLPPSVLADYKELEREFILKVESGQVIARNAGVLSSKLRQFTGGAVYSEGWEHVRKTEHITRWHEVHTAKLDAISDLVDQLQGEPALIAYEFDHERQRLQQLFPGAPYIGGGVSAKAGAELQRVWNAGELPVLLVQPQSAAHGLNLQRAGKAVVWYSMTWNLEHYDQLIRRVWRQGREDRVFVYHLIARGTVDEDVLRTLGGKDRTQNSIVEHLKRRAA